jgi:hypothetical protein
VEGKNLKEGSIIEGPFWPERIRIISCRRIGVSVEIYSVGLDSGRFYPSILPVLCPTFPGEIITFFKKLRTIVTKMEQKFIPQIAEIIAKEQYIEEYRNYEIVGQLDVARIGIIDSIINSLRMRRRHKYRKEILTVKRKNKKEIRVMVGLFIRDLLSIIEEVKAWRSS